MILIVKGEFPKKEPSLLQKILAILSDPLDPVDWLYCRKHRLYYERPPTWREFVFVMCPKCFEERFGREVVACEY